MTHQLQLNNKVFFEGERLPYLVKAINDRYAICTRKLNRREDAQLLWNKVEMNAFISFTEAYNHLKTCSVYTIIDFKENKRGTDDYVFSPYDYSIQRDIDEALSDISFGRFSLSKRNLSELLILDEPRKC
jgi:hypothetical protein